MWLIVLAWGDKKHRKHGSDAGSTFMSTGIRKFYLWITCCWMLSLLNTVLWLWLRSDCRFLLNFAHNQIGGFISQHGSWQYQTCCILSCYLWKQIMQFNYGQLWITFVQHKFNEFDVDFSKMLSYSFDNTKMSTIHFRAFKEVVENGPKTQRLQKFIHLGSGDQRTLAYLMAHGWASQSDHRKIDFVALSIPHLMLNSMSETFIICGVAVNNKISRSSVWKKPHHQCDDTKNIAIRMNTLAAKLPSMHQFSYQPSARHSMHTNHVCLFTVEIEH